MNKRVIGWVIAWLLKLEGYLLLLPCVIACIYQEKQGLVYLAFAIIAIAGGYILSFRTPKDMEIYQREGNVAVGLGWIFISLYGALPFMMTGEIPKYVDAVFEIVSGFTTTGSSILKDVEALSHTSLFWRSFSHWIGGMGVLVFILMLLPARGGSHMNLMKAESPGVEVSKFVPKVKNNASALYRIYIGMTVAMIIVLLLSGMNWFDSFCITFGAAGTGGFGVLNSSCASYTAVQQWIITVGMIAFGVNFTFYFLLVTRHGREAVKMEEVQVYIAIIVVSAVLIALNIHHEFPGFYESWGKTFRDAFFQVGTIITTTGYSTTNFDLWPPFSKMILFLLMIFGACAGSTGGGIKISRLILAFKTIRSQLYQIVHPRGVRQVTMSGQVVNPKTIRSCCFFLVSYFAIFGLSILLISVDGQDFETNVSAVAATLNNIGPGFGGVGPTCNFAFFSTFSKIVLIFDMLIGRLEIIPILILFYPRTWKNNG
jgi:trk system potassium uptake protein TrkH